MYFSELVDKNKYKLKCVASEAGHDLVVDLIIHTDNQWSIPFTLDRDQWEELKASIDAEFAKVTPTPTEEQFKEYIAIVERMYALEQDDSTDPALDREYEKLSHKAIGLQIRYGENLKRKLAEHYKTA